jgi:aminopeptidase N
MALLLDAVAGRDWTDADIDALAAALEDTVTSKSLDPAFKSLALSLPPEQLIARTIGSNVDPDKIRKVRLKLIGELVARLEPTLTAAFRDNQSSAAFSPDTAQSGQRALKNQALTLLVVGGTADGAGLARRQYDSATNMTDRFAALAAAVAGWTADAEAMLGHFRTMFTADPLVFDKWLGLSASIRGDEVIDRIKAILADPAFPANNPNRLRSLVGSFAMGNATQFARPDGAGFRFVTEFVADVDKRNPQVAARVLTAFRIWRSFEPVRMAAAETALTALRDAGGLSRNTADILERTLAG